MASGKRIFGTLFFVIAFLAVAALVFLLYARSTDDPNFKDYFDQVPTIAIFVGAIVGFIVILLILLLLIRSSAERQRLQAFQEEQDRLAAEREALAAFESSLQEPEKIGWGPELLVYNLPTIPQMYRGWEKFNRRTNSYTFYYPRSVESAVYTNNYIPIDDKGTMLKLRTLIAGPPGAQSKDPGMAHQKRPAQLDPKAVAALGPKWQALYDQQTGKAPPQETTASTSEVVSGDGRTAMLQEIESRFTGARTDTGRAYYDYEGDVHEVEEIEGIGRIYGEKLRAAGVHTTARLCYEDAEELARRVGVPVRTVEQWKAMSELVKVSGIGKQYAEALARSGISGVQDLKRRSPGSIAEQVNQYLGSLHTNVLGTKVTEKRVEGWQKAAAKMRKVRMKAPEK